jgi:hypothetical protein
MGALAIVVVGILVIVGLIEIVHERIRESRRLDDISLEGKGEIESDQADDAGSPR